jgi:hypothetical protein
MINFTKTDIDKIKIVFNEFKELQCFDYEIYFKIEEDYQGRFFEYANYAIITNLPYNAVIYLISKALEMDNIDSCDIIERLNNLSIDDFGKDAKIYY